jgi:hypothetical protein
VPENDKTEVTEMGLVAEAKQETVRTVAVAVAMIGITCLGVAYAPATSVGDLIETALFALGVPWGIGHVIEVLRRRSAGRRP